MNSWATRSLVQTLGNSVKEVARNRSSSWWYTPHMAASSRAVADRIPLVDIVLEVRDARIPLSSKYGGLKDFSSSSRHVIVLNKADLAKGSVLKEWVRYFDQQKSASIVVNAHNKDSVKELLNFLQARVRELVKATNSGHTRTIMLIGIPNVGKSALANSLHQIGRISAAEKGKLKHAIVSPHPGETKNISSLKIASHPSIYVIDSPGILPPEVCSEEVCSKLALTGAIDDFIPGKTGLAQYLLAILSLSDEYKKWERFCTTAKTPPGIEISDDSNIGKRRKKHYSSDHTQDFIVNDVRRAIFEAISCFNGDLGNEKDLLRLIEAEFDLLPSAFCVAPQSEEDARQKVSSKLLDLYRTGRLGHYVLDTIPNNS